MLLVVLLMDCIIDWLDDFFVFLTFFFEVSATCGQFLRTLAFLVEFLLSDFSELFRFSLYFEGLSACLPRCEGLCSGVCVDSPESIRQRPKLSLNYKEVTFRPKLSQNYKEITLDPN